jgi:hypothetical protein
MVRPLAWRRPVRLALVPGLLAALVATARAQESVIFSTTGSSTAGFGALESSEVAMWDAATGVTRPWLMVPTSAYFAGDVDGDLKSDVWSNVDALWVDQDGERVRDVWISFATGFGAFSDGDVVRLKSDGSLELVHSEAELMAAFGLANGMDLDGLHVGPDGRMYVSFADDETSGLLSTDVSGVITDGSIVWWDPINLAVGIEMTESMVDAAVSHALNKTVKTGDTLGVAMDRNGVIAFSVQSPSSDDASVFSAANGGEYVRKEADLGLSGSTEIDALDLCVTPAGFLAARATPRSVPANTAAVVDVDGPPGAHGFVLLIALQKGDSANYPLHGFGGLALDPADPLFLLGLAGLPWLYGTTDAAGHGSIVFPNAPAGVTLTLFGQAYDFDAHTFGAPIALEFEG